MAYVVIGIPAAHFSALAMVLDVYKRQPVRDVPADAQAADYQLGEAVALRGYRVATDTDGAALTLYWQALDFPRAEVSAFVHALDAAGKMCIRDSFSTLQRVE